MPPARTCAARKVPSGAPLQEHLGLVRGTEEQGWDVPEASLGHWKSRAAKDAEGIQSSSAEKCDLLDLHWDRLQGYVTILQRECLKVSIN